MDLEVTIAQPKLLQIGDRLDVAFILGNGVALSKQIALADDRKEGLFGLASLDIKWTVLFSPGDGIRVEIALLPRN